MRVCDWVFKRGVGDPGSRVRVCGVWRTHTTDFRVQSVWGMWKEYEKSVQLKNNLLQRVRSGCS